MDHFAALGLPRTFALDPAALEHSYLRKSRQLHPDHQRHADPARQAELLQLSAALNNAYKTLTDPFARAEHLVELLDPEALARTKQLPKEFLLEAMELSERVADCDPAGAGGLATELRARIAEFLDQIAAAFAGGGAAPSQGATAMAVAGLLHRSKYWRKALEDLTETMDE